LDISACLLIAFAIFALSAMPAMAVKPTQTELKTAKQWTAEHFQQLKDTSAPSAKLPEPEAGIIVISNNDPVQKNSKAGTPLKVGEQIFQRGLFCHAFSRVIIRLPAAGSTFTALAGPDNNDQTSGGRGSLIMSVEVAGNESFKTGIMHGGDNGVPVKLELGGAREFTLLIGDAGDGIACDQADWADAKVTLSDGREIWLDDLPFIGSQSVVKRSRFNPPFSFIYNGKASDDILGSWTFKKSTKKPDPNRTQTTQTYTDPVTGLQLRCEIVKYSDYPTVEWTLHFKNTGKSDTPILENIRSLDAMWNRDSAEFLLHHAVGSPCLPTDYRPLDTSLEPKSITHIGAAGGRPTNSDMSYFNLDMSGKGVIIVVGWPGQWDSKWIRDEQDGLRVVAGQELTRFTLHPGEEVRTPLTVLQFWQGGDWIRAQNIWRRWMVAHNTPKPNGKVPPSQFVASSSRQYAEMINANEQNQKMFIDRYLEEGIKLDYWWMDAGWYENKTGWPNTGTWEVDAKRFPNGLRAVSDYAHSKGIKIVTWFEPERVTPDTWLTNTHPEWILGGSLLNLGNKEAWTWLTNHMDKMITEQGIDLYRQDFNMDPLSNWRAADTQDRMGITEIGHVTGFLAYWDELLKRHPDLLIDTCASGGRRNDIETLRRSVPLWRTDCAFGCIGTQAQTYGISFWIPYSGTGTVACQNAGYYGDGEGKTPVEAYAFFSNAAPSLGSGIDLRIKDLDYPTLRQFINWFREYVGPSFYGDYYPLTPYTIDEKDWIAWQFDNPEEGKGVIEAFRRAECPDNANQFKLRGLDPSSEYTVKDLLANKSWQSKGSTLIDSGLHITVPEKPGVAVIVYERVKS